MDDNAISEELLVEMVKRVELLEVLADGPRDASELTESLDASRSTIHRATRSLAERDVLCRSDDKFELTGFGHVIADEVIDFRNRVVAAGKLRPFFNTVELTDVDVPMDAFTDATVVHPKPHQPHFAVERIIELIEETESVCIFSSIISPVYAEAAYREMVNGTEIEVVFDQQVAEIVASEYADKAVRAAETGQFEVFVHADVPFELFVFESCIGMAAHDENGIARVFVETDAPAAVGWAESVYEFYRSRADPVDASAF